MESNKTNLSNASRRSFLKKASYVAPAILTLPALPSFASVGSGVRSGPEEDITDIKVKDVVKKIEDSVKSYEVSRSEIKAALKKKKNDKFPPGLQNKLDQGKSLPPGWQKKGS